MSTATGIADPSVGETRYDATVIQQYADGLYAQAKRTVIVHALLGALIGLAAAFVTPVLGLLGALLVGAIGYVIGQNKAFSLRLQAQTALCQVQIERNTRRG